jgi:hypothetical protein
VYYCLQRENATASSLAAMRARACGSDGLKLAAALFVFPFRLDVVQQQFRPLQEIYK